MRYMVKQKVWSFGDDFAIKDADGNDVFYVDGKAFSLGDKLSFKDNFTVDVPGPNDYKVTGNFWDSEYAFERQGRNVARVSKAYFSWSDTYGIDIDEGEDDVTILATAVVIDLVCHDED